MMSSRSMHLAAALSIATASMAVADTLPVPPDTPDRYANRLPLQLGEARQGLHRVQLPLDVYRGIAHGDLRDLRVFNADGEPVPFAIVREPARAAETQTRTRLPFFPLPAQTAAAAPGTRLDIRIQPDGTLVSLRADPAAPTTHSVQSAATSYIVDASRLAADDEALHALHFDWRQNADAVSVRVRVEAGGDLSQWRDVVAAAPLADLRYNGERLRQTRITLPAVRDKYLRLSWDRPAFVLTAIEAETHRAGPPRTRQRFAVAGRPGERAGEYLFDLGARIAPQALALIPPQANTLAPARLFALGDPPPPRRGKRTDPAAVWLPVTGATFYRLTSDGGELASPPVDVPDRTPAAREWKAVVDARGGGLGSGLPELEVTWQPAHVVFAARGREPFALAFGRNDAPPAQFQIAELMPGYRPGTEWSLPAARLAIDTAQPDRPAIAPPAAAAATLDGRKLTLWIVLALGVAALALLAARLARTPKQDKDA